MTKMQRFYLAMTVLLIWCNLVIEDTAPAAINWILACLITLAASAFIHTRGNIEIFNHDFWLWLNESIDHRQKWVDENNGMGGFTDGQLSMLYSIKQWLRENVNKGDQV
jgi:hypothetical protein